MADPISGELPLKLLKPSPHNPRKTMDEAGLEGLAASFAQVGILQPLTVRPIGKAPKLIDGVWSGVDHFEIIAGHRRFAAAKLAKLQAVPVLVREMTDDEAETIMAIENDQREDVKPSEQAVAYKRLADKHGLEETARRVGRPLSAVRELVRLSALPAWFLSHVDSGLVSRAVAAIVARVPGEEPRQMVAFAAITGLGHWQLPKTLPKNIEKAIEEAHGRPQFDGTLTVRQIKSLVSGHFSRELKSAPFSRKALDLVPAAGSCDECPKRAGNDPDMVAEGVRADICTDTDCFAAKVAAYQALEGKKLAKNGDVKPLVDVQWSEYNSAPQGYVAIDETFKDYTFNFQYGTTDKKLEKKTISAILKTPGAKPVQQHYAFHPKTGKATILVSIAEAKKALVAMGIGKKEKGEGKANRNGGITEWEIDRQAAILAGAYVQQYAEPNFESLDKLAECGGPDTDAAYEALLLVARWFTNQRHLVPDEVLGDTTRLAQLSPRQLLSLILRICTNEELRNYCPPDEDDEDAEDLDSLAPDMLKFAELDWEELRASATRVIKGEVKLEDLLDTEQTPAKTPTFETVEDLLKHCLCSHNQGDEDKWSELRANGGTDAAIYAVLKNLWSQGGASGPGYESTFNGGATPTWFGRVGDERGLSLTGQTLVQQVRSVLEIPQPKPAESSTPPEGPMVCKPLGSIKLGQIEGITEEDSILLADVGLITLFDLERESEEYAKVEGVGRLEPTARSRTYDVLRKHFFGKMQQAEIYRIGDAIIDHLTPVETVVIPAKPKRKAKSK